MLTRKPKLNPSHSPSLYSSSFLWLCTYAMRFARLGIIPVNSRFPLKTTCFSQQNIPLQTSSPSPITGSLTIPIPNPYTCTHNHLSPAPSRYTPSYLSSPTHSSTNLLAPKLSPSLNSAATSTFNGLSTPGHDNNILTARTHSKMLYVGVHASLSKSKQISPVSSATLACTMGVANEILGGCSG